VGGEGTPGCSEKPVSRRSLSGLAKNSWGGGGAERPLRSKPASEGNESGTRDLSDSGEWAGVTDQKEAAARKKKEDHKKNTGTNGKKIKKNRKAEIRGVRRIGRGQMY